MVELADEISGLIKTKDMDVTEILEHYHSHMPMALRPWIDPNAGLDW